MQTKWIVIIMHLLSGSIATLMFVQQTRHLKKVTYICCLFGLIASLIQTTLIIVTRKKAYR